MSGGVSPQRRRQEWAFLPRTSLAGPAAMPHLPWSREFRAIYLLTAHAKADRGDLTAADRKALSRLVAAIRKEEKANR